MRVERPADWETHGYLQLNPKPLPNPSACGTSPIRAPRVNRGEHCVITGFAILVERLLLRCSVSVYEITSDIFLWENGIMKTGEPPKARLLSNSPIPI